MLNKVSSARAAAEVPEPTDADIGTMPFTAFGWLPAAGLSRSAHERLIDDVAARGDAGCEVGDVDEELVGVSATLAGSGDEVDGTGAASPTFRPTSTSVVWSTGARGGAGRASSFTSAEFLLKTPADGPRGDASGEVG